MKPIAIRAVMLSISVFTLVSLTPFSRSASPTTAPPNNHPKIQAAILLDVSNSMDGLIDQAKAQLWNMVSVMGKASCKSVTPSIEIALYEYGRSNNDVQKGYVKQICGFTKDLDLLSKKLFELSTNGGEEYCGQVIFTSMQELKWDTSASAYKVIFISGNEDFLQGNIRYTKACDLAKNKGVIVNTIYCGEKMQGIREHWNLGAECNGGSYTNINPDARIEEIPTPYDSTLYALNQQLNKTYIYYGSKGEEGYASQAGMDQKNYAFNKTSAAKRIAVKSSGVYINDEWDLVDAAKRDPAVIKKVEMKTLPADVRNKSRQELETFVKTKTEERGKIQKEIQLVNTKREAFVTNVKAKEKNTSNGATLETEVEKIIKQQAKKFELVIP